MGRYPLSGKVSELEPGEHPDMRRKISVQQISTGAIFPGTHAVEVQVNGRVLGLVEFAVSSQSNARLRFVRGPSVGRLPVTATSGEGRTGCEESLDHGTR